MIDLVLDASASVDLLLDTSTGRQLQDLLPHSARWWVPEHFYLEVSTTPRRAEMHEWAASELVAAASSSLAQSHVIRAAIRPLLADAWTKRHNLTIADALYVVLAEHLGASLVTSDLNLANAPTLTVPTIHPQP